MLTVLGAEQCGFEFQLLDSSIWAISIAIAVAVASAALPAARHMQQAPPQKDSEGSKAPSSQATPAAPQHAASAGLPVAPRPPAAALALHTSNISYVAAAADPEVWEAVPTTTTSGEAAAPAAAAAALGAQSASGQAAADTISLLPLMGHQGQHHAGEQLQQQLQQQQTPLDVQQQQYLWQQDKGVTSAGAPPVSAAVSAAGFLAAAAAAGLQPQLCLPTSSSSQVPFTLLPAGLAGAASAVSVEPQPSAGLSEGASSSSSAVAFTTSTRAGSAGGSSSVDEDLAASALLTECGVSLDSLLRLLTADSTNEFEQPVWMVVNLQGKIKGSYTPGKLLEFCRRGTLSLTQLMLGIDQNLPYLARQDLSYYRKLEYLLQSVHRGLRYMPLNEATVLALKQQGVSGEAWQPLEPRDARQGASQGPAAVPKQGAAVSGTGGLPRIGSGSGQALDTSRPPTPASAAAQLHLALERLCGCSVTEAMLNDPVTATSVIVSASTLPPALTDTESAGDAVAEETHSSSDTAGTEPSMQIAENSTAAAEAAAAPVSAAPEAAADPAMAAVIGKKEPMWLYINHLGWCRGPFPGARIVQAHMCGRLPRDTLIAAHAPDVPSAVVRDDIAYFFRPLGVLLDNIANGWTYNTIHWSDVSAKATSMAPLAAPASAEPRWEPLRWDSPGQAPPLVNPEQLQPPKNVPSTAQTSTARGRGVRMAVGESQRSGRYSARLARRAHAVMPTGWPLPPPLPQQQQQQQQQQEAQVQQELELGTGFSPSSLPTSLARHGSLPTSLVRQGSADSGMGSSSSGSRLGGASSASGFLPTCLGLQLQQQQLLLQQQQQQQQQSLQLQQQQQLRLTPQLAQLVQQPSGMQPLLPSLSPTGSLLLGHVQQGSNQPALPVYGPSQLLLSGSLHPPPQLTPAAQQQQQQVAFNLQPSPTPQQLQQQQPQFVVGYAPVVPQQVLGQQTMALQQQQQQLSSHHLELSQHSSQPMLSMLQPRVVISPQGGAVNALPVPPALPEAAIGAHDTAVLVLQQQQQQEQQQHSAQQMPAMAHVLQPLQQQQQVLHLQPLPQYLPQQQQLLQVQPSLDQLLQQQVQLQDPPMEQQQQQQQQPLSVLSHGVFQQSQVLQQQVLFLGGPPPQQQQQELLASQMDLQPQQPQQGPLPPPPQQQQQQPPQQQQDQLLPFWQKPF